jgi:membrane-bound lytic murein transglycosylase D
MKCFPIQNKIITQYRDILIRFLRLSPKSIITSEIIAFHTDTRYHSVVFLNFCRNNFQVRNIGIKGSRILGFYFLIYYIFINYTMSNLKKIIFFISLIIAFSAFRPFPAIPLTKDKDAPVSITTDLPLPETVVLCGESLPLQDTWVWEMLDRELTIIVWDKSQVFMWLKRAGRYFPYLEKKLAQENMPEDLKYLSVAESALLPNAKSNQGAVGPWQFMAGTAKENGLRNDNSIDERFDLEQSTEAALNHLKRLKEMFGNWTLAMAAYNCGENRVKKEITEQQESDFYKLRLPNETERYIFRIAVIKLIMENPEYYGYRVPESKTYKPLKCETLNVNIKNRIHITDFAKAIGTTYKTIRYLNPQIIDDFLPMGAYNLKTPPGTLIKAQEALLALSSKPVSISDHRPTSKYYVVQQGDTLSSISRKKGIPLDQLKKINNLKGSVVKVGEILYIE